MDIQKINENNTLKALSPILQTSTVQAIKRHDFKEASRLLPRKIELVFDEPKISEVVKVIGEDSVKGQIEFELIKLASLMSVGGNLNRAQIGFISSSLIEQYPNESIADFKICFERGAIGVYGDIQRMDGITIGVWFKKYLDEKYEVLEDKLKNEKDTPWALPTEIPKSKELTKEQNEEQQRIWQEGLDKWKANIDSKDQKRSFVLSETENLKRVKKIVKPGEYPVTSANELLKRERHFQWIQANFDPRTGDPIDKDKFMEETEWIAANF